MDHERFRDWFSRVDELTAAQRKEVAGDAVWTRRRARPRWRRSSWAWMTSGAVRHWRRRRGCVAGQGARSSPLPLQGVREDVWRAHAGTGAVGAAPQGALAVLWRLAWRGRDDQGVRPRAAGLRRARRIAGATASWRRSSRRRTGLPGIVEADETFVLESRKGQRKLDRKPRRRGGKAKKRGLSREQVPVLVAADRAGATLSHTLPALNADNVKEVLGPVLAPDALLVLRRQPLLSARRGGGSTSLTKASTPLLASGFRGAVHIQTVNSRHSQIKGFLRRRRGIATKYLDSYLRWFHLIALGDQPSPRACLEAAMAKPCLRFAN